MIDRRTFMALMAAAATSPATAQNSQAFSRDWLINLAKEKAQADYVPRPLIPEEWRNLDYDQFQHIWFNVQNAIWKGEGRPLELDLFTAGLFVERATTVHLVENGQARTLAYDLSLFDKTDEFPDLPIDETMGYSGIRLRAETTAPDIFQEFKPTDYQRAASPCVQVIHRAKNFLTSQISGWKHQSRGRITILCMLSSMDHR